MQDPVERESVVVFRRVTRAQWQLVAHRVAFRKIQLPGFPRETTDNSENGRVLNTARS